MDTALSSEELFLQLLKKVYNYYTYHEKCLEQEGLEEYKGTQNFVDKSNKILLH